MHLDFAKLFIDYCQKPGLCLSKFGGDNFSSERNRPLEVYITVKKCWEAVVIANGQSTY